MENLVCGMMCVCGVGERGGRWGGRGEKEREREGGEGEGEGGGKKGREKGGESVWGKMMVDCPSYTSVTSPSPSCTRASVKAMLASVAEVNHL